MKPMKILYIYTAIVEYGGVDRILTQKANYLAEELGYDVYIVTDSQHGCPTTFPLSPSVKLIDLGINFDEEYKYHIYKRFFVYRKLMKLYKKRLLEKLQEIKPDIVCTTCGRELDFLTTLKDGSKKVGESHIGKQYFRNFHRMERKGFPYNVAARYWMMKQEHAIKNLDAFVVLTHDDAKSWSQIKTAEVIPNPYTVNPETTSDCKSHNIISVGRFTEQKSLDKLFEAWAMICNKHEDWKINLYGAGELQQFLEGKIKDLHIEDSLKMLAPVDNIQDKYIESSFFVMSSKYEGFPLVLLEAMRCGLPCISFDCPHGPRELIKTGGNGILVKNGDVECLAKAMEEIMENDDERVRMGKNALATVEEYSPESIMKKWSSLFEKVGSKKNILFLIYHGFSEYSGISKKIHYQVKGLRELGYTVHLCTYDFLEDGHRVRSVNNVVIEDYGTGWKAAVKNKMNYNKLIDYVKANNISFVYARSFHNANPFTIKLFKRFEEMGIKSVIEIPTYPYDQEYINAEFKYKAELAVDKVFRDKLASKTDGIVTFTNDKEIFGQKTVNISNGIDFDNIPLRHHEANKNNEIHFLSVAEVHYWHGFDRFIAGIGEYYKNGGKRKIVYHIVGGVNPIDMEDNVNAPGYNTLINKYGIKDNIVLHGPKYGEELDQFFDTCDFAVGSLARHRSGITYIKTLKNREYAVRGIPFIYSETDEDFEDAPYIIKAPADETPIDIEKVIQFSENLKMSAEEIRNSVTHLSWKNQMKKVMDYLEQA